MTNIQTLDRLVGTWQISGGAEGTVIYEWMEGGHFLIQHVHLSQNGQEVKGIEMIGHLKPFGESKSPDIRSRYYDTLGNTFDYVYELEGDSLVIWAGDKGSPSYYKGAFRSDGDTHSGAWHYPGGGGYETMMTRVSPAGGMGIG
ncbi:hypothetical protein [Paenibacillus sp. MDMC362]|uniref:hypothetical protein n=1 Tax=Paenibacillus sp. MDMC362 TaxID=2977365 RepID=UPI000DC34F26|nr:hypothetical protein [Paenibacillus sp. MDMC362]RAR42199.1 hypothetical protein DP091_19440 [Paenibacillus sp. MDMC362]